MIVPIASRALAPSTFCFARDVTGLVGRLLGPMMQETAAVVHVTSCGPGQGVSTVARELAYAASRIGGGDVLLLDGNAGSADQSSSLKGPLPDILESYAARGAIEVVEIKAEATFHAAHLPQVISRQQVLWLSDLGRLMQEAYKLIVVDCRPILEHPFLAPITEGPPRVLLVLRASATPIPVAVRVKEEIEELGGELWGVVMTNVPQAASQAASLVSLPNVLSGAQTDRQTARRRNFFAHRSPIASDAPQPQAAQSIYVAREHAARDADPVAAVPKREGARPVSPGLDGSERVSPLAERTMGDKNSRAETADVVSLKAAFRSARISTSAAAITLVMASWLGLHAALKEVPGHAGRAQATHWQTRLRIPPTALLHFQTESEPFEDAISSPGNSAAVPDPSRPAAGALPAVVHPPPADKQVALAPALPAASLAPVPALTNAHAPTISVARGAPGRISRAVSVPGSEPLAPAAPAAASAAVPLPALTTAALPQPIVVRTRADTQNPDGSGLDRLANSDAPVDARNSAGQRRSSRGLLLMARPNDTISTLYEAVYRGVTVRPPLSAVAALNPAHVGPGDILTFPAPPGGWIAVAKD